MTNVQCTIKHHMSKIYQLKITLKRISPAIWRRIEVSSDIKLDQLAQTILRVMGWHGGHLMSFEIGREEYQLDQESVRELGGVLMSKARLDKCLRIPKQKGLFTYDFGDDWEHDVLLEKILEAEEGIKYPRCTAGKRNCPPEDCGGHWGYADILKALKDPDNPENEELLDWVGEDFDPEEFDLERVNGRI